METNIKQKIDLIAECIFTKVQTPEDESFDYGLYSGKFGILLFLLYYSRFSKIQNIDFYTVNKLHCYRIS